MSRGEEMHGDGLQPDDAWRKARFSRRNFVRLAAAGTGVIASSSLLMACGSDDEDDPAPTATVAGSETGATDATATPADAASAEESPEASVEESPEADAAESDEPTATSAAAESELPGATLTIRNRGEIVNLDPHLGSGNPDAVVSENIYSRLVLTYPDAPVEPVPDLATEWEISEDGLEYTFQLREGVQWHREYGECTAADVVWTYERVRDPDLGSRSTGEFANVSAVEADDDYTVRITLAEPDPTFLYAVLARVGAIGNQQAIEEKGDGYTSEPVGTGPYIFEEWVRGGQAVLVKNEGHWLHEGNVDQVIFKFLTDDAVTELALRSGDLDMAYVETPESQRAVIDNADLISLSGPAPRTHMTLFTGDEGTPTADVRVRRAMAISINRQLLAEEALDGMATPAHSLFHPGMYGYLDTEFFAYDPDEARRLLDEAGYGDGVQLDFICISSGVNPLIAAVLQAQWGDVGIETELSVLERALYYERRENREFDVCEVSIARDFPESILYPYFTSAGAPYPNALLYDGVADLAEELRSEQDFGERADILGQIQETFAEDVPAVPTVYPNLVLGMREGISEFPISIWYYPLWLMEATD